MRSTSVNRRTAVFATAAAVALGLTACSNGGSGTGAASDTPQSVPSAAGAASTLTVWADASQVAALKTVIATFEKQYSVKVNLVQKDGAKTPSDFIQQAPTGKAADVFIAANDNTGNLALNGVISPITIPNESAFQKVGIQAVTYDGKTYGMPVSLENIALLRNTKLDPTAHDKWDDLIAAGNKLKASGKVKYPIMIQSGANGAADPYHLYPLQTSFGVPVFGSTDSGYDSTDLQLGNADSSKWAEQLAAWGKSGVLNQNYTYDIALNAFNKGQTPYIITGPWSLPKIKDAKISYAIDKVPSVGGKPAQPFVGVQAFYVNKYTKNALLANKFVVDFMGSQPAQLAFYKTGQRPPALTAAFDAVQSDKDVAAFGTVGADGVPLPNIPAMASVWSAWGNTEGAIISGKASNPDSSWSSMAKNIESTIKKAG